MIWLDGAVVFDGAPAPAVLIGTRVLDARLHELRISYSLLGLEPNKRVDVRTRFPFFGAAEQRVSVILYEKPAKAPSESPAVRFNVKGNPPGPFPPDLGHTHLTVYDVP